MPRTLRLLSLFGLILLSAKASIAQVTTGTPPFGSFNGSPDVVNLANLNAHLTIPVFNKAGRGVPFYYNLQYDTSTWYPTGTAGNLTWTPVLNWGLLAQTAVTTGELNATFSSINCMTYIYLNHTWVQTGESFNYGWISYIDSWGISHPINATSTGGWGTCGGAAVPVSDITVTSPDGSGFTLATKNAAYSDTVTITARDGTVTHPPINSNAVSSTYTDRNGNQISVDGSGNFTDTLGSIALAVPGSGTPSSPMKLTYTPPSGTSVYFQVNYTNYTIATNFGISTIHEYKSSGPVPLVTSIVLPDGSRYSFNYESTPSTPAQGACTPYAGTTCVTARLTGITLPTGGTIAYTYTSGNNGILSDGSTSGLTRVLTDGSSWSATWTYTRTQVSGAHWQTTINDPTTPTANQTIIDFQGLYETKRITYQGSSSGQLLQTINTCYNGAASPCTGTAITLPIMHVSQLVAYPDNTGKVCEHDQYFNTYGLQTEQDDYDYGTGAPATTPLRKVITVYNSALTNGIVSMPSSITTCNGTGTSSACTGPSGSSTGTVVSQTTFAYDETTPTNSSPVSPQWTSITGSRGNATTIKTLVQGSTFLSQTNSYYDTGNLNVATDVNGVAQTTYAYSGSSCGNAFPTSVSEPLTRKIRDFINTKGLAMVQIRCLRGFETKSEAFA